MQYEFTYMWSLKSKRMNNETIQNKTGKHREQNGGCQRDWGTGEIGEGGQEAQISSLKVSKSWRCIVQSGDYSR